MSQAAHSPRASGVTESGSRSVWRLFARGVNEFNALSGYLSAIVVVITSLVVCYGVIMRYFFNAPLDWGLELSIFLLIIATFMSAGFTQQKRGHVTIEVLEHMLSPAANRWRYLLGDVLSLLFCGFLAWNAWHFFYEAYQDGRVTESAWGPKLWIPYFFMALGCTALSLQLLVQIVDSVLGYASKTEADAAAWKE